MKNKKTKQPIKMENVDLKMKEILSINIQSVNREEEGKTISIGKLPPCKHKELMEMICIDADVKICVIAWLNKDDSWEAYAGYPDMRDVKIKIPSQIDLFDLEWKCDNIRGAEHVRLIGDKLEKEAALILFPDWSKKEYKEENNA